MRQKLSQNLAKRLKLSGLTQKGLAVKAGLNETAVRDIIQGRSRDPQYNTLSKISKVLGCTVEELYNDSKARGGLSDQGSSFTWPSDIGAAAQDVVASACVIDEINLQSLGLAAFRAARFDVVHSWAVPSDFLRRKTDTVEKKLKIVEVSGQSMAPDFASGDKVLVDLGDKTPSPAGVFLVWDGAGFVLRHCELLLGSGVRKASVKAGGRQAAQVITAKELIIAGRVIGKWMWC